MPYFSLCDLTALLFSSFAMKTGGCSVSPAVFLGLPQHQRKEENLERSGGRRGGKHKQNVSGNYSPQTDLCQPFPRCLPANRSVDSVFFN